MSGNDDAAGRRAHAGARLDRLAEGLLERPGVARTTMFGSAAVSLNGKLFALIERDGRLMVKVPAERAASLVAQGGAVPARIGRGTAREWVSVDPADAADAAGSGGAGSDRAEQDREWTALLLEAHDYAVRLQASGSDVAPD